MDSNHPTKARRRGIAAVAWLAAGLACGAPAEVGRAPAMQADSDPTVFRHTIFQNASFYHTRWSGLGSVFDVKQAADGYLWLITSKGVVRFDGVQFQSVEEATFGAVHSSDIDSVFPTASGGLWLSTEAAGLLYWKAGRLTEFNDRRCTPTRKMGRLIEDADGAVWVQAAAGLFHLRGSVCEAADKNDGYPGGFAAGMLVDRAGTLWVKTRRGPLVYLPRGESKFQTNTNGDGPTASYAYLHEAPDGTIWLSDDQGLRRVTGTGAGMVEGPGKREAGYGDFAFGADGALWVVTQKGVRRFENPGTMETSKNFTPAEGLSSDAVWKVMVDREGSVWVATNSGLDRLRRAALSKLTLPQAQEHEFAIAAGDGESIWTGNSSLALTRVAADGKRTGFPEAREILCVRRDHNGTIWAAGQGEGHLWRFAGTAITAVPYPEENLDAVVSIAVDRNHDAWITTRSGRAYRRSQGEWTDESESLGKKPGVIGSMADDTAGNVWFGFSNKVVEWDGSTFHKFSYQGHGVSENTMTVRGDHVWLGGAGGVQLFSRGGFYTLRLKDPELPGRVSGIVETGKGELWINGFSGITHVPAEELKKWLLDPASAVAAERLDELDGLPGLSGEKLPEPSVVEAPDGRLWFATTNGVAWLDPAALEKNRNRMPPQVNISNIVSSSKSYPSASGLTLPARADNVEIDYTALSLAIPERVMFRYKLDGVDGGWQNVGARRQAYYTRLRPGRYQFHVMASNNDGVWNEAGASLDFRVAPAWFQTSWFFLLCLASAGFAATAMYRLRVRQIAAGINARFDARLAERTRIAQELHDTLLQGFLSASMQVHVAADRLPEDSDVKPILTRALQLMRQVTEEGRNAVRGLRLPQAVSLDLEHAFARTREELGLESSERQARFQIVSEGQKRTLRPLVRDEVLRIGREALTNSLRHARAHHIEVVLKYAPHQFRVVVRDDGCGIDEGILREGRDGHWGLSGMQERAERMGGKLHVFSSASAGTKVDLSVAGQVAYEPRADRRRWFRKAAAGKRKGA